MASEIRALLELELADKLRTAHTPALINYRALKKRKEEIKKDPEYLAMIEAVLPARKEDPKHILAIREADN